MMPLGPILLVVVMVLITSGFLTMPLQRLGLADRTALLLTLAMLSGSLVEIPILPGLSANLGAAVLPFLVACYLLIASPSRFEVAGGLVAAMAAAAALTLLSRWLPPGRPTELNLFFLDAQYFYAIVAGAVGYLVGHGRPAAYAGAVLGVLAADVGHYLRLVESGLHPDLVIRLSGGGFHGTAVVAGLLALTLSDLLTAPPVQRGESVADHLS